MQKIFFQAKTLGLVFFSSLIINACTTAPEPAPPPPVVVKSAPPPPPPVVIPERSVETRMEEPLVRAAGNHAVLMTQILTIPNEYIASPQHLNQTMDGLSQAFSPGLGPALISYGALIGAQNTGFTEGILETARIQGVDTIIYQLYTNPNYVAGMPGVYGASKDIQSAWASDIAAIAHAGEHIKKQSYDLQKKKDWKKMRTDSRPARLQIIDQAKSLRYTPPHQTRQDIAKTGTLRVHHTDADQKRQAFWRVYGRGAPPLSQTSSSQYNGVMHRKALTLTALEVLGATGNDSKTWIENSLTSPKLNRCITKARLNTAQCVAAGYFKYEDAFCMAEHQLKEISTCLSRSVL